VSLTGLKISELATLAGVQKSTVQHYIREGLLPGPIERPHKNVAYYSADLVPRIQLIRKLQSERHLPLSKIRDILDDEPAVAELRAHLEAGEAGPQSDAPVTRAELLKETELSEERLDRLEELGLIRLGEGDGEPFYNAPDAQVVRGVVSMQRAGFEDAGFGADDLLFYLEGMRTLVFKEIGIFTRVMGHMDRDSVLKLAHAGLDGTNHVLMGLRRKIFLELLTRFEPDETSPDED
jgi:DNA-binding transcriptional MerR regulator